MIRLLNILVPYDRSYTELLDELRDKHPDGASRSGGFEVRLPDDDPCTLDVIRMLDDFGLKARRQLEKMERGTYYWARPNYEYEQTDLEMADYFEFVASKNVELLAVSDDGHMVVSAKKLKPSLTIAEANDNSGTIVSEATRLEMEEQSFVGLLFLFAEAAVGGGSRSVQVQHWNKIKGGPFWQIRSSITLPQLHPKCQTLNRNGEPCNGNYEKGCFLVEGDFPAGELNYLRSDFERCEPFDIAVTQEPFGNGPYPFGQKLVVSKRFREFVLSIDPKSYWVPVYVHDS